MESKRIVKIQHYLITFSYPTISRYGCYECPGAYHIEWKQIKLIKTRIEEKQIVLTDLQKMWERVNVINMKFYDKIKKNWFKESEYYKNL